MLSEAGLNRLTDPSVNRLVVALSGGVDSVVLLHLLRAAELDKPLSALHINHGLQQAAADFEDCCVQCCATLNVPLTLNHVKVAPTGSLEQRAREARYSAFADHLETGDLLLLAHHADDQVETALFRLIRGSRLAGLEGMPAERTLGKGSLFRPLLEVSRDEIEDYASNHELQWVEDPTNADLDPDRNYLRHEVLPVLRKRWPDVGQRLLAAVQRDAAARSLLNRQLSEQLETYRSSDTSLALAKLRTLDQDLLISLLDNWMLEQRLPLPSSAQLREVAVRIQRQQSVSVSCQGFDLREHNGQLYVQPVLPAPPEERFTLGEDVLRFPEFSLSNSSVKGQGLRPARHYEVGFRTGGESIRMGRSRTLKNLLQSHQVPDWIRPHVPLIFDGTNLVAVAAMPAWNLPMLVADGYAAGPGESGWLLEAHPKGAKAAE